MPLPLLFVTVGTDHHPFHRLIEAVDGWLLNGGREEVACVMQTGTSRPPRHADWKDYLSYEEMERYLAEARAVVCHGGPGTILLCLHRGKRPVVMPRQKRFGEHVDDHQLAFARRLAEAGQVILAEEVGDLPGALDLALAETPDLTLPAPGEGTAAAALVAELVEGLFPGGPRDRALLSKGGGEVRDGR